MITKINTSIKTGQSLKDLPPAPSKEELEKMLKELIVRFDTSPKLYEKQDFGYLIKCIVSLFSFQGSQVEEIEKLLNNNGRIVNGLSKPVSLVPGYSWLNKNNKTIITYKTSFSDFSTYTLAEGDGVFVISTKELYALTDGNLILTGSLEAGTQVWSDLK